MTLADAQAQLDATYASRLRTLDMEEYSIEQQATKRTNLRTLDKSIRDWTKVVNRLSGERRCVRVKSAVPHG